MSDSSDCSCNYFSVSISDEEEVALSQENGEEEVAEDDESAVLGREPHRFDPNPGASENQNLSLLWPAHFDIVVCLLIFRPSVRIKDRPFANYATVYGCYNCE